MLLFMLCYIVININIGNYSQFIYTFKYIIMKAVIGLFAETIYQVGTLLHYCDCGSRDTCCNLEKIILLREKGRLLTNCMFLTWCFMRMYISLLPYNCAKIPILVVPNIRKNMFWWVCWQTMLCLRLNWQSHSFSDSSNMNMKLAMTANDTLR